MTAFQFRMAAGIAGDLNRAATGMTVEAQVVTPAGTAGAPTAYGVPMVVDATGGNVGNMRVLAAGDTSLTAVYGMLVRPFPTQSPNWPNDPLGTSTPPASGIVDILKRGYMTVLLSGATAAAKGGTVYVYIGASATNHPVIGGIEAATSSNAIALPAGCYFMGPADSGGITEIAFNI